MLLRVSGSRRDSAPRILRAEQEALAIARDFHFVFAGIDSRGLAVQRIRAPRNCLHVGNVRRTGKTGLVAADTKN